MKKTLLLICLAALSLSCGTREPEYTGYLFAHMTNTHYGHLYYSLSRDGKEWETIKNGEVILEDYLGHPNISRGADKFYMMGVTTSGELRQPVLWSSTDLINWDRKDLSRDIFDVSAFSYENEPVYLGAPKIFYDEANERYMVTWHAYDPTVGKGNPLWESMRTFYFLTSDWETFTKPERLFYFEGEDEAMATIDVILNKEGERYYALIKDERWPETASTGKTIRVASSESLTGPYTNPGPSITDAWEEAPVALRKNDGTGWYLFTERYMEHSKRYTCREVDSFENPTWAKVDIASPEDGRHGCVIPVTEEEYQAILALDEKTNKDNFRTAFRGFYLWRCGMQVDGDHNGNHYHIDACHLKDGRTAYVDADSPRLTPEQLAANQGRKDGTGGWHDAGDFGKYTVNAGITMGMLFYAWDHFGDKIKTIGLDLPETAPGYPEYLEELKWETDFLHKMEYSDGSGRVSHKLTRQAFSAFIMPEDDDADRFFTVWSSAATADFAAVMAMSSVRFRPYDKEYADKCLEAAKRSWAYLEAHPEDKLFDQGDFSTGSYWTMDPDDRLWAAAEMWAATGEPQYLAEVEGMIGKWQVADDWDWGDVANLGLFTYALCDRKGKNPELQAKVVESIIASADRLVENAQNDPYGCALKKYYWGCNGTACRQAINLHIADIFQPNPAYGKTIKGIADYILGHNYYHRSFVTGIGVNPPMRPHDRRSGADGIDAPWPGYLVGGGHTPTDWVDDQNDYSRNEIAINWQGALVYLLAAVL